MAKGTKPEVPAKTAAKKPYVGMSCVFIPTGRGVNNQPFKPQAAIVTELLDEGAVNLQVFHNADAGSAIKLNVPQLAKGAEVDSWAFCAE